MSRTGEKAISSPLRLVYDYKSKKYPVKTTRHPVQVPLFSDYDESFMAFVSLRDCSLSKVLEFIEVVRPTFVLDLRAAPRFDSERITRRYVFDFFSRLEVNYEDLPGRWGVYSSSDSRMSPESLADELMVIVGKKEAVGPLIFLTESQRFSEECAVWFPQKISPKFSTKWSTKILRSTNDCSIGSA